MKKRIKMIPEKTCPICGERVNRRKGGTFCPYCGAILYSYRVNRKGKKYTIWVTDEPRIRDVALRVRDHIRKLPHMEEYEFTYPERQYGSAHTLLNYCEGNQQLAFAVVDAFYDRDIRHQCGIYCNFPRAVSAMISGYGSSDLASLLAWCKHQVGYKRNDLGKETVAQVEML